jgi:Ca2+-binding RTX toxin-like protein
MPTIRGNDNDNVLRGTEESDVVWGLEGADSFYWASGRGNDTYHGDTGGENYNSDPYAPGNPGGDRLLLDGNTGATITFRTTDAGSVEIGGSELKFDGFERFFGTGGNDVFLGRDAKLNTAGNGIPTHGLSIFAGGGDDSIVGSRFEDVIDGGSGDDTIKGGGANDFIHSNTGSDLINGGNGTDNIRWGNGDANHNPGNDTISGGGGVNDLINMWIKRGDITPGNEAAGIDGLSVKIDSVNGAGSMTGGASTTIGGNATVRFSNFELGWTHEGNDTLDASDATISGKGIGVNFNTRWGHDRLTGSRGDDTLDGSLGKDTLDAGRGDDQIWIGDGTNGDGERDVLIFNSGDGKDTVYGFDANRDVVSDGYRAREVSNGTLLDYGDGDTVLLQGVYDFI